LLEILVLQLANRRLELRNLRHLRHPLRPQFPQRPVPLSLPSCSSRFVAIAHPSPSKHRRLPPARAPPPPPRLPRRKFAGTIDVNSSFRRDVSLLLVRHRSAVSEVATPQPPQPHAPPPLPAPPRPASHRARPDPPPALLTSPAAPLSSLLAYPDTPSLGFYQTTREFPAPKTHSAPCARTTLSRRAQIRCRAVRGVCPTHRRAGGDSHSIRGCGNARDCNRHLS
jgi:hypothetical protein